MSIKVSNCCGAEACVIGICSSCFGPCEYVTKIEYQLSRLNEKERSQRHLIQSIVSKIRCDIK